MSLQKLRSDKEPKLMIIPMIDIIFFLLVFFMISTLYTVNQRNISIELPQTSSQEMRLEGALSIMVLSNGNVIIDGEETPLEGLQEKIKAVLLENPQTAFVLHSDAAAPYGTVVEALDELKLAGVSKLAIATKRKDL